MSDETYIQRLIRETKEHIKENGKGLGELLLEVERDIAEHQVQKFTTTPQEYHFDISDINKGFLEGIHILEKHRSDIHRLNFYAHDIFDSNLKENTKLKLLEGIEEEYKIKINAYDFFLRFEFPITFIETLRYIFEEYEGITQSEEFVEAIATAFVKVQHYKNWCNKHRIGDKGFRDKKERILKNKHEFKRFSNQEMDLLLPIYPQDILIEFLNSHREDIPKKGISVIIELISGKERQAKQSKFNEYEIIRQKTDKEISELIQTAGLSPEALEKIVAIKKKNFQQ